MPIKQFHKEKKKMKNTTTKPRYTIKLNTNILVSVMALKSIKKWYFLNGIGITEKGGKKVKS